VSGRCGIEFDRFLCPPATKLEAVGYATIMERYSEFGVEQKRGVLAQRCATAAGLKFIRAEGFTPKTMPYYYTLIGALIVPSLQDGSPRPPLEAAASGRLVISTPVGHVPQLAYEGLGIMGPLDAEAFVDFTTEKLLYFKRHLSSFAAECTKNQKAARARDWPNVVGDWIELFNRARG
jgi:glycosyltransferase involved in cell wall biosynthesis